MLKTDAERSAGARGTCGEAGIPTPDKAGEPRPRRHRTVVMLCAHDPDADPRVLWEAQGASDEFDVHLVGLLDPERPSSGSEGGPYEVIRLTPCESGAFGYVWRVLRFLNVRERLAVVAALLACSVFTVPLFVVAALNRVFLRRVSPDSHVGRVKAALIRLVLSSGIARIYFALRNPFGTAARTFEQYLGALPRPPDIVHCNDLETLLPGALAKARFGCRLVYDAHEFFPESDPKSTLAERFVYAGIERALVRRADAVVTVSPLLADVMRRAYGLKRVEAVPNAEPLRATAIEPLRSRVSALAEGRTRFLFQGRFAEGRGLEELVAAWVRVDPSRAALFLRGPDDEARRRLQRLAERLGLLNRSVYFVDSVHEHELVAAAAEADVGVIPYKAVVLNNQYACPNKLSQYLHAGIAVLTNDLPYVRTVVEAAGAGVVCRVEDSDSVIAAVERLCDPIQLATMRRNALRYACETFNWQAFSGKLYELYRVAPSRERGGECAG